MYGYTLPVIVIGFMTWADTASAQEHCVAGLRVGLYDHYMSTTSASDNSTIHNQICEAYKKYESDKMGGDVKASYGLFSGSASLSREQVEAIGQSMCQANFSKEASDKLIKTSSSVIAPTAVMAYQRCLELSQKGLRVEIDSREEDRGAVTLSLSYLTDNPIRPKITGISLSPEEDFSCKGTLWDVVQNIPNSGAVELDRSRSMLCTRKISQTPIMIGTSHVVMAKPATILVETEAGAVRYHLAAIPVRAGPDEMEEIRSQLLPVGTIILTPNACPENFYIDVTADYDGRFLRADAKVSGQPTKVDADGSHTHDEFRHRHDVTGRINVPPGNGMKEGSAQRSAAGTDFPITGTTDEKTYTPTGGAHTHSSVGLRLCQKVTARTTASAQ
ncbi:hypothetical protein SAE02_77810 [Skermanella aerolata]|uniref:Uncharacterized protein n=1 Tax=Skermanella aerolata TaxID=393310 RepID=A0A512E4M2_9PROT|nr:hypothetical protein [Skermanella aerolata]GEO43633.1 hypothetical protein SAE02_77810 [Skermanella aerolata]